MILSTVRTARAMAELAMDAAEALVFWFNSDAAADRLWKRAKPDAAERLAEAEAEYEVSEACDFDPASQDDLTAKADEGYDLGEALDHGDWC